MKTFPGLGQKFCDVVWQKQNPTCPYIQAVGDAQANEFVRKQRYSYRQHNFTHLCCCGSMSKCPAIISAAEGKAAAQTSKFEAYAKMEYWQLSYNLQMLEHNQYAESNHRDELDYLYKLCDERRPVGKVKIGKRYEQPTAN